MRDLDIICQLGDGAEIYMVDLIKIIKFLSDYRSYIFRNLKFYLKHKTQNHMHSNPKLKK